MNFIKINQLLFHPKSQCLSFFLSPLGVSTTEEHSRFLEDIHIQLGLQGKKHLAHRFENIIEEVIEVCQKHPHRSHGFFLSEQIAGFMILENPVETYCAISSSFHIRPILEEIFVNLEYVLINISPNEVRVYRADLQQVEFIKSFDFANQDNPSLPWEQSVYSMGDYSQLIPHRTFTRLKIVAFQVVESLQLGSLPVLVSGNPTLKEIFLKYFLHSHGVIDLGEDLSDLSCISIMGKMKNHKQEILDYYSANFKARLMKLIQAGQLVSDLQRVIKAAGQGEVLRLMIPTGKNLWGKVNFKTGKFSIAQDSADGVDILNELAEEVIRQGGKIQFVSSHFFPAVSTCLAILKKVKRKHAA